MGFSFSSSEKMMAWGRSRGRQVDRAEKPACRPAGGVKEGQHSSEGRGSGQTRGQAMLPLAVGFTPGYRASGNFPVGDLEKFVSGTITHVYTHL